MSQIHNQDVRIYSLSSNRSLALEIAKYLKVELDECNVVRFADGEVNLNLKDTARGHHCFIVQSTSNPVNENYMELFIMIDALKRASARTINIIMPYYGYARQDRKAKPRQPITAKLVADLLTKAGAQKIVVTDIHATQFQGFFDIPMDDISAMPLFYEYFSNLNLENLTCVSPDHGGVVRTSRLAEKMNAPIAIIDKRRPEPNKAEITAIVGDIEGKDCIIVDDIVDTAGTLVSAINVLKEAGAKDIYMCATHAVLSGPAIERLQNAPLKELVVTNSIPVSQEDRTNYPKVKVLSIAWMLSKLILAVSGHKPVSDVYALYQNNN